MNSEPPQDTSRGTEVIVDTIEYNGQQVHVRAFLPLNKYVNTAHVWAPAELLERFGGAKHDHGNITRDQLSQVTDEDIFNLVRGPIQANLLGKCDANVDFFLMIDISDRSITLIKYFKDGTAYPFDTELPRNA
ncbi:MAG: hypothetical protein Q9159_004628 [Coniocarpon cinnabarinum]